MKIGSLEAAMIMIDPEYYNNGNMPYQVINEHGKIVVEQWVEHHSVIACTQMAYWFNAAENAANDRAAYFDVDGEAIIIEMSSLGTISGHAETLTLDNSHFDWHVER